MEELVPLINAPITGDSDEETVSRRNYIRWALRRY